MLFFLYIFHKRVKYFLGETKDDFVQNAEIKKVKKIATKFSRKITSFYTYRLESKDITLVNASLKLLYT